MVPVWIGLVDASSGKLLWDDAEGLTQHVAQFKGEEIEATIQKRRKKRSDRQNRAFHAALTRWADDKRHDVEQLKDDLLALRWGYIVRQNILTGEIVKSLVKPHTSDLSTSEFAELFDLAAEEAAKDGHVMQFPDEFKRKVA
jgi:hypothetical protein